MKRCISFLLFYLTLFACGNVFASELDARCLLHYQKLERHVCGQCHLNIIELLEQFPSEADLSKMQVLYLKPPWVRRLKAYAVDEQWIFHVVLQREGRILDPDFSKNSSLEIKSYLKEMYRIDEVANNDFEIIVIPAKDYLAEMGKIDQQKIAVDHDYYLNKEGYSRYPKIQASEVYAGKSLPTPAAQTNKNIEMLRLIEDSRTIEWRDGDWILRMAEGKIISEFQGNEVVETTKARQFFAEIEERSKTQERIRRALHNFWAMGGRRP
jgi:hypothetical protein